MYPTKKEILKCPPPKISQKTLDIVISWKLTFLKDWKDTPKEIQIGRLEALMFTICVIGEKLVQFPTFKKEKEYKFNRNTNTIYQNKEKPSIISALHETAHCVLGPDELTACRWSVYIFRTCFPTLYKQLKWKGHLLIKK